MPVRAQPKPPFPKQRQKKPGSEAELRPRPRYEAPQYRSAGKLEGLVALITGGDSGIGRAVAVLFAREGADVAFNYLPVEQRDAEETRDAIEQAGQAALLLPGDLTDPAVCQQIVTDTAKKFGRLDILVNNAAFQQHQPSLAALTDTQLEHTFRTNILSMFRTTRAALKHMRRGACIINTGSITGLEGSEQLLDYSATERRDPRIHQVARAESGVERHPGELRRAGPSVDAAQRVRQTRRQGRSLRRANGDGTSGATGGSGARVRLLRLERRLQLHHGRGAHAAGRRDDGGVRELL